MNIVITGGGGFIGFHLACFHAKKGHNVFLYDNLRKNEEEFDKDLIELLKFDNVELFKINLINENIDSNLPKTIDVLYHLAAINGTELFYEIPYELCRNNIMITIRTLDSLKNKKVKKVVYSSSSEVYSGSEKYNLLKIPTDENIPVLFPQPTDTRYSYGTSKFIGEFLCFNYGKKYDIPTSCIRFHNIYGPRMGYRHVIPEFIKRAFLNENPFKIYGSKDTRAFCYVDDAVKSINAVAESDSTNSEIIHIGKDDEEIQIITLAEIIAKKLNKKFNFIDVGGPSSSVSRRCPNTNKLHTLTGYKSSVDLYQGLESTISWYVKDLEEG